MIEIRVGGDDVRRTIAVAGDLDRPGLLRLQQALDACDVPAASELVFDFAAVGFIGASAISHLVRTARECEESGRKCRVESLPPALRELFAGLHLEKVLEYR